jgi:predicted nucleic acid-binding protein
MRVHSLSPRSACRDCTPILSRRPRRAESVRYVWLVDTSGLLAAIDGSQRAHAAALAAARAARERPLSPFVLAELDYMLATRVGAEARDALLDEVVAGTYRLERFDVADLRRARSAMRRFADLDVGLADASLVVLAERYDCRDVLTLDERHFRALRFGRNRRFRLLPAEAQR